LYGLNHIRFHSWCPPGAAFDVADSLGFYLQVELPMWSLQVGEDPKANRFIAGEAGPDWPRVRKSPLLLFLVNGQ
jgi:hypothetical protein